MCLRISGELYLFLLLIPHMESSMNCTNHFDSLSKLYQPGRCNLHTIPKGIPHDTWHVSLCCNQITSLHSDVFSLISQCKTIALHQNKISSIQQGAFKNLKKLTLLFLQQNRIQAVKLGVFNDLVQCDTLYLDHNSISCVENNAFNVMKSLKLLSLYRNAISVIKNGSFTGLQSLQCLWLNDNSITHIEHGSFAGLNSLRELNLKFNKISVIEHGQFRDLFSCIILVLHNNLISSIQHEAFKTLESLEMLDLDQNKIVILKHGHFTGLSNLRTLKLGKNRIMVITKGAFHPLFSLNKMSLDQNLLTVLSPDLFHDLPHPLVLSLSSSPGSTWDCSSLCWLKYEEHHKTMRLEGIPTCAFHSDWKSLQCGNPGKFFFLQILCKVGKNVPPIFCDWMKNCNSFQQNSNDCDKSVTQPTSIQQVCVQNQVDSLSSWEVGTMGHTTQDPRWSTIVISHPYVREIQLGKTNQFVQVSFSELTCIGTSYFSFSNHSFADCCRRLQWHRSCILPKDSVQRTIWCFWHCFVQLQWKNNMSEQWDLDKHNSLCRWDLLMRNSPMVKMCWNRFPWILHQPQKQLSELTPDSVQNNWSGKAILRLKRQTPTNQPHYEENQSKSRTLPKTHLVHFKCSAARTK